MHDIFLDNNASTRPLGKVILKMNHAMDEGFGNPSSAHRVGEKARRLITRARGEVSALISCTPSQLFFTSGATESNNWALQHLLSQRKGTLVSTEIEHSSVKERLTGEGHAAGRFKAVEIDLSGQVETISLGNLLPDAACVSIHWVNNETGVVQPIQEISRLCLEFGVPLHVDASQAVGKLSVNVNEFPIDYMTFTAHKLHGPQGIGALYVREPRDMTPACFGGGQESGLRPGTENLPGIAGFGEAAAIRNAKLPDVIVKLERLRDAFEHRVLATIPDVFVNGGTSQRVCNTTNLLFKGIDGQALVAQLDAIGVQCSQSSACTAQIPEPSYVLRAMGLSEDNAFSSVRFSVSELNTFEEIETVVDVLTQRVTALRDFSKNYGSQE